MKVSISPGFLLLAAGIIYLDGVWLFFQCCIACFIHESGHYISARLHGCRVHILRITAVGAEMTLDSETVLTYPNEIRIALAGPCMNLIAVWTALRFGLHLFAGLNLCFGLLNLFPVRPLDGGRVIVNLLSIRWPLAAENVVHILSLVFSGALFGLGWAAWKGWGNLSLLCTAAWILTGCINEKNK